MAQTQDTHVAPHQIDGYRQQRVAEVFTEQSDGIGGQMQRVIGWNQQIENRNADAENDQHGQQHQSGAIGE